MGDCSSASRGRSKLGVYLRWRKVRKNVRSLAETLEGEHLVLPCDIANDEEIDKTFNEIKEKAGVIHGLAHCIAFANKEELEGEYLNVTRDGYLLAQNISAYSLTAVAKAARPLMSEGEALLQ